ncbi:MAG: RluA family pseudouridine synthase [Treponema sp.]|nr:RluA family pseudouridine synthase [Treponema sp.]
MKNIEILYEDDFSIIINKPAGLAVQGGKGVKNSLDKILAEIRNPPPLLVHRLDKDTSGLILAAKGKEAAARFSRLLGTERQAVKQYTAICAGRPEKKEGIINEDLIIRNSLKKSETRYKVLKSGKLDMTEFSVLELELGTGRTHQIRRHLAMNGNPILGDDKYGDFTLNKKLRKSAGLKRLLLHASRLVIKEINLDISAPPPEYFNGFLNNNLI